MSNLLYSKNEIVASIKKHFSTYFSSLPRPTQENLLLLIIGMYAMESFDSVRSCFTHLLKKASNKSLNAYYRTLDTVSLEPMDFITPSIMKMQQAFSSYDSVSTTMEICSTVFIE